VTEIAPRASTNAVPFSIDVTCPSRVFTQPLAASGDFPDPVFGHPVELLVTDKSTYADTGEHWRRGEAKHIARRVQELVDTGAAAPGEIVLLFAAGTDAEWYEEELRTLGLPTYRATGRG